MPNVLPTGTVSTNRRQLMLGAVAIALLRSAPVSARQDATPQSGNWTFVDDAGVTISLPQPPRRVVAYLPVAAAFHDFGAEAVGYYGVGLREDGTRETIAGSLDLESMASLGEAYGEFDLEQLVALQPDLIVNDMWEDEPPFWGLDAAAVEQIAAIAPIANISFVDRPITDTIATVEKVALAMGADPAAPQVAEDRAAFDAAVADLKAAIAEKPGLTVAFVSGTPEEAYWVGNPLKLADLSFYQELGLDIVQPENTTDFSEELSWEQAGKYPADLLILDDRQWSSSAEELVAQVPTFAALPAAKAGAFALWPSEWVPSYPGMTPVLTALAEAIRAADPDVVP